MTQGFNCQGKRYAAMTSRPTGPAERHLANSDPQGHSGAPIPVFVMSGSGRPSGER